jgi:putative copper export protein
VLAATVWVGGQLTLAALVPVLRRVGPNAPRVAARRLNVVAWPAYGVLIATGIWNIAAVSPMTASYRNTFSKLRVITDVF